MALTQQEIQKARAKYGLDTAQRNQRIESLRRAAGKMPEEQPVEAQDDFGIVSSAANFIGKGVDLGRKAIKATKIPKLAGLAGRGAGTLIGGLTGLVGGTTKEVIEGLTPGGKSFELGDIARDVAGQAKRSGDFAAGIVEEGVTAAPFATLGRVPSAVMAAGELVRGTDDLIDAIKTGDSELAKKAAVEMATGTLGAFGAKMSKGRWLEPQFSRPAKNAVTKVWDSTVSGRNFNTVDDVINAADDVYKYTPDEVLEAAGARSRTVVEGEVLEAVGVKSPQRALAEAKAKTKGLNIRERWAGIDEAVKNRLYNKPKLVNDYLTQAHARNMYDTELTPYGLGAEYVQEAARRVDSLLGDTGGAIGQFRQKIETVPVPLEPIKGKTSVRDVFDTFEQQMNKLNLEIKDGKVVQPRGKVRKSKAADIELFNELLTDLKVVQESPRVSNVIDARVAFDNKVNFAKDAREVSGVVDPVSRVIRKKLAEMNRQAIGKEQSALLAEFSDLMDIKSELNRYINSRAGEEYLIRLVLSARGREALRLIETLKKYTGIDLMDHAVMARVATDIVGNDAQKTLFRSQIQKAGMDAAQILAGGKLGIVSSILKRGVDKVADPEKLIRAIGEGRD